MIFFPNLKQLKGKTAFQGVDMNTHTYTYIHTPFLSPLLLHISSPLQLCQMGEAGILPRPQLLVPHPANMWPTPVRGHQTPYLTQSVHTHTSKEQGVASLIFMESVVLSSFIMWFLASISSRRCLLGFHLSVKQILWKSLEILQSIKSADTKIKKQLEFETRGSTVKNWFASEKSVSEYSVS